MFTLLFVLFTFLIFGKLFLLAVKTSWGLLRIVLTILLLPFVLIILVFAGMFYVALPVLVIAGVVSLICSRT